MSLQSREEQQMASTKIQDYDPMELTFSVREELFDAGRHPEDGEQMEGVAHYVMAEAPDGTRWYRFVGTVGWKFEDHPDGDIITLRDCYIEDNDEPVDKIDVECCASMLATRLNRSTTRRLNPTVWDYAGACYGSAASVELGCEAEQIAAEEREAESWG
jgi:hypothetical protein